MNAILPAALLYNFFSHYISIEDSCVWIALVIWFVWKTFKCWALDSTTIPFLSLWKREIFVTVGFFSEASHFAYYSCSISYFYFRFSLSLVLIEPKSHQGKLHFTLVKCEAHTYAHGTLLCNSSFLLRSTCHFLKLVSVVRSQAHTMAKAKKGKKR